MSECGKNEKCVVGRYVMACEDTATGWCLFWAFSRVLFRALWANAWWNVWILVLFELRLDIFIFFTKNQHFWYLKIQVTHPIEILIFQNFPLFPSLEKPRRVPKNFHSQIHCLNTWLLPILPPPNAYCTWCVTHRYIRHTFTIPSKKKKSSKLTHIVASFLLRDHWRRHTTSEREIPYL